MTCESKNQYWSKPASSAARRILSESLIGGNAWLTPNFMVFSAVVVMRASLTGPLAVCHLMRGLTDAIACTVVADGSGVAVAASRARAFGRRSGIRGTGEAMKFGISLPTDPPIGAQVEK